MRNLSLIGFDFFSKQTNVRPMDKRGFRSNCKPHSWHLPVYVLNRPAHDSNMEINPYMTSSLSDRSIETIARSKRIHV